VDINATALFVGAGLLVLLTALGAAGAGFVALFDEPIVNGAAERSETEVLPA
jgi:hypothetical protein